MKGKRRKKIRWKDGDEGQIDRMRRAMIDGKRKIERVEGVRLNVSMDFSVLIEQHVVSC